MALIAVTLFASSTAEASSSVLVRPFTGAKKKALHDRVARALERDGVTVATEDGSALASAVISGNARLGKKGWVLTLTVRSAADGAVLDEVHLKGSWLPGLLEKIDEEAASALRGPLERADAAAMERQAQTDTPAVDGDTKTGPVEPVEQPARFGAAGADPSSDSGVVDGEQSRPRAGKPSALVLAGAMRGYRRDFTYHQDVNENLRPYGIDAAPAVYASVGWYPAAHFTSEPFAHLGIVGDFEQSIATASGFTTGGEEYATSMQAYSAGVRARLPLRAHEIGASVRYGLHRFEVSGDVDPGATVAIGQSVERDFVPDVAYEYVRPGIDGRFRIDPVEIGAYAGYRHILSMGDLASSDWFPSATAMAADAGVFVGYRITESLSASCGFDWRRYGVDMNSDPADLTANRDVAGGAVDQYLTAWLGIEWQLHHETESAR